MSQRVFVVVAGFLIPGGTTHMKVISRDEKNGSSRKPTSLARRGSARRRSRSRAPRDAFVTTSSGLGEEETNLGSLLKRALASEQAASSPKITASSESEQEPQHCADCWHATTFNDKRGNTMTRCEKNLWVRPVYSYDELNRDRVRRWHVVCPEYDDSD